MITSRSAQVTRTNEVFYEAFESLDIARMDQVWARQEYVTCIHPGWSLRSGWPEIRDSWVQIFNHTFSMTFAITDLQVQVTGDIAWVVCIENLATRVDDRPQESRVLATNLFERIGDEWRMIHHHGSAILG